MSPLKGKLVILNKSIDQVEQLIEKILKVIKFDNLKPLVRENMINQQQKYYFQFYTSNQQSQIEQQICKFAEEQHVNVQYCICEINQNIKSEKNNKKQIIMKKAGYQNKYEGQYKHIQPIINNMENNNLSDDQFQPLLLDNDNHNDNQQIYKNSPSLVNQLQLQSQSLSQLQDKLQQKIQSKIKLQKIQLLYSSQFQILAENNNINKENQTIQINNYEEILKMQSNTCQQDAFTQKIEIDLNQQQGEIMKIQQKKQENNINIISNQHKGSDKQSTNQNNQINPINYLNEQINEYNYTRSFQLDGEQQQQQQQQIIQQCILQNKQQLIQQQIQQKIQVNKIKNQQQEQNNKQKQNKVDDERTQQQNTEIVKKIISEIFNTIQSTKQQVQLAKQQKINTKQQHKYPVITIAQTKQTSEQYLSPGKIIQTPMASEYLQSISTSKLTTTALSNSVNTSTQQQQQQKQQRYQQEQLITKSQLKSIPLIILFLLMLIGVVIYFV